MQVHTLPPRGAGRGRGREPSQSCGCKPNGDARCCATAACGCSRAGLGCSVACHCRGFARVCANANAPLPKPAPRKEAEASSRDAKKPKPTAAGPFAGAPRRLADVDDAERAAAAGSREAFLAALEAQRAAASALAVPAPAAAAPPPPAPPAAPAAVDVDVIDLCDSGDDDAPAAAAPPPKPAAHSSKPKPAAPAPQARPPPRAAPAAGASAFPRAPLASYDPFNPPQYVPEGGFKTGGELRVREPARLRDLDGVWLAGLSACLDTGNEGCTLLSFAAARRAGLVDAQGVPAGSFGAARYVEVRGVVAGAAERVPTMRIEYDVAGVTLAVTAGVTRAALGCDLLVSRFDILKLEEHGFRLSAKA